MDAAKQLLLENGIQLIALLVTIFVVPRVVKVLGRLEDLTGIRVDEERLTRIVAYAEEQSLKRVRKGLPALDGEAKMELALQEVRKLTGATPAKDATLVPRIESALNLARPKMSLPAPNDVASGSLHPPSA